jgi:acetyl esterase/lipase
VAKGSASIPALASEAAVHAPFFGPLLAWAEAVCAVWPVPPTRTPAPTTAVGSPPILVVGATKDPATPYEWAQRLAAELEHGELVTWQGENHVAYYYSACVRAIDQAYFVAGTLPPVGTVCSD